MAKIRRKSLVLNTVFAAASVFGAAVAMAQPAQAQYYGRPMLSERNVLNTLQARGFRRMSPPVLNNDVFVLDAVDPRGMPVRLIVSAFNGSIVDAHPQRQSRWSRMEPDSGWNDEDLSQRDRWRRDRKQADRWENDRWQNDRWQNDRWRDRHARLPDQDWQDDQQNNPWRGPQIDADDTPEQPAPRPRNAPPERVTVNPLPAPSATPRDPDLPQPTLKNPTIVKRSPTAIPKDPSEKPATSPKPPSVSVAPQPKPGMGTRDNPRVIDMTPKAPATTTAPKAAAPAPAPKVVATPESGTTTKMPPPATLDLPKVIEPATPVIPPAPLE